MATLDLSAVQKTYPGGNTAVHHVDASIDDGEFIVIVGPSGCGKSTLLRMVAGLEGISNGEIRIDGARVNELEPARRDIAMVFQNYALYPHMSVFDNMAYALKLQNRPKDEIRRRVEEAAAILELDALLTRRPRQLSGGQRQRVAMGRAIVRQPRLFLFDEPLSNLDARLRVQMRLEIQRLHRRLRTTSLYVTHDQVEAMTLAQRMIVMNLGRVEQIGTPAEVYERPASTFVASFIGAPPMNLLPVRMNTDGDATTPDGMRIPAELLADTPTGWHGQDVLLGIRPEHLSLTDPHQGLALQVEMVEALGAEVLVYGRFGTHTLVLRLQGDQLGASRQSAPQAGAIIGCRPNRQQGCWHAYAPDTGMRLPD